MQEVMECAIGTLSLIPDKLRVGRGTGDMKRQGSRRKTNMVPLLWLTMRVFDGDDYIRQC